MKCLFVKEKIISGLMSTQCLPRGYYFSVKPQAYVYAIVQVTKNMRSNSCKCFIPQRCQCMCWFVYIKGQTEGSHQSFEPTAGQQNRRKKIQQPNHPYMAIQSIALEGGLAFALFTTHCCQKSSVCSSWQTLSSHWDPDSKGYL